MQIATNVKKKKVDNTYKKISSRDLSPGGLIKKAPGKCQRSQQFA